MPHALASSNASKAPCSSVAAAEDAKKAEISPAADTVECRTECSSGCSSTSPGDLCATAVRSNPSSPSAGPRKLVKLSCDDVCLTTAITKPVSGRSTTLLGSMKQDILKMAYSRGGLNFGSFTLKSGRKSPFFFNSGCFSDGESMELLAGAYAMQIVESRLEFDVLFGPAYKYFRNYSCEANSFSVCITTAATQGIPLAACTAMVLARDYSRPCPFLYDRKETKDHGEGGQFVGAVEALSNRKSCPDSSTTADESRSNTSGAEDSDKHTHTQGSTSNEGDTETNKAPMSERADVRAARVMVLDDVLTAGRALRSSVAKLRSEFPHVQVVALCLLLDRQERMNLASPMCASQQLEAEMNTQVLSILRMRDILEFVDGLVATAATEQRRKELEEARRELRLYLKTFSGADVEKDQQQDK